MTRNWDLLRLILNQAQLCTGGYPLVLTNGIYSSQHYKLDIKECDFHEVCEHILLLGDAGLAEVRSLGNTYEGTVEVVIDRLTMAGHDFLESARDEAQWQEAIKIVTEKGGGAVTIGIMTQILSSLLKQSLGLQ